MRGRTCVHLLWGWCLLRVCPPLVCFPEFWQVGSEDREKVFCPAAVALPVVAMCCQGRLLQLSAHHCNSVALVLDSMRGWIGSSCAVIPTGRAIWGAGPCPQPGPNIVWAPVARFDGEVMTSSHKVLPVSKNSIFSGHISHAYFIPASKVMNLSASSG